MNTEQFDGHTPGPWDYESGEDIWAEDRLICRMSLSHSERPHYRATNADARLIAAAPDLLAEVKRWREGMMYALIQFGNNNDRWDYLFWKLFSGEEE